MTTASGRDSSITVAIDARFVGTGTGLARYSRELIHALWDLDDPTMRFVHLVRSVGDLPAVPQRHRVAVADYGHYTFAEQVHLPRLVRAWGADVLFSPHFNVPMWCPVPLVVTVHDLILHRHPGDASVLKRAAYRLVVRRAVTSARAVLAVSEWTYADLQAHYGDSVAAKTVVTREGVSDGFVPSPSTAVEDLRARYALPDRYFLYVGNAKPHKQVEVLLDAFVESGVDAGLVLLGAPEVGARLPARVQRVTGLDESELSALYTGAQALVTLSLEEGYCLPVAEALACGTPVIASNRSAIPDTAQGHAMLIEPDKSGAVQALRNPPADQAPVRVGSWTTTAATTADVLRRAAR